MLSWQKAEGDDTELEMKDEEPLDRLAGKRSATGVNRTLGFAVDPVQSDENTKTVQARSSAAGAGQNA
ncbi:hypothetical protein E4U61_000151 [Claviceps capensis]|nr:hypothetical protein E4U61_000151 [Claviceps capensis]